MTKLRHLIILDKIVRKLNWLKKREKKGTKIVERLSINLGNIRLCD